MICIESNVIISFLLMQIRNGFAEPSAVLSPIKERLYQPVGEEIDLIWRYFNPPEPDKIVFRRASNGKSPVEGAIIGSWSTENGFQQDKYHLSTNTRFEMKKEDGGHHLIELVLLNPCSEDYNMSYYCEIKEKPYFSKISVDLERPEIERKVVQKNGNHEFIHTITYSKELVLFRFQKRLENQQDKVPEEICYKLFNETSIEDKFKDRIILNREEINGKEVFNVTILNTTYQDSGEYFAYFVFKGGDNRELTLNISIDKIYSNERKVLRQSKNFNKSSSTGSITESYYYTILIHSLSLFLFINI